MFSYDYVKYITCYTINVTLTYMYDQISWTELEFPHHERSSDWYWIYGIVVVIGALIAIILNNILFGIFILLAGGIVGVFASKRPDEITVTISRKGIQLEDKLYTYRSIDSFWIDETNEERPKLLLELDETLALQVVIPIGDVDLEDLRDYLEQYIEEHPQNEGIVERLMEYLKI